MISIFDKKDCVGCGNCQNVCLRHCISMTEDEEGFLYPRTNEKQCVQCGLCERVCPVLQDLQDEREKTSIWLGGYNRNDDTLLGSSSGGVFHELASFVLQQGGLVCGAVFVSTYEVAHIIISNVDDLHKLQKSKYVQSNLGVIFPKIRNFLKQNKLVLFSGTPCQVKALNLFVAHKAENLLTVEVVCHGVPSPRVLKGYMEEKKIRQISFRDKKHGWSNYEVCCILQNGKTIRRRASKDLYMRGFFKDLYNRPSCSQCPAKALRSGADFTLGDLWGVGYVASDLNNDNGVSLVGLHTKKANAVWKSIKHQFVFREIDYNKAVAYNPSIAESFTPSSQRPEFFSMCRQYGAAKSLKKVCVRANNIETETEKTALYLWNKAWAIVLVSREWVYLAIDFLYKRFHQSPIGGVKDIKETLICILESKCSVSRFGDGELKFVKGDETWFQHKDIVLQRRLREILKNDQPNLMVCVPNVFGDLKQYRSHDKKYWRQHIARTRKIWYKYLNPTKPYYDAFISRCYMPYKNRDLASTYFDLWKKIWNNRELLIIEGEKTRLGIGNDLFDNVKSIKRILCPNTNAFKYYESLLSEALRYDTSHLVLLAVGPTATVLAADLANNGYQAIDVGHIDIEYEWYLSHATRKIPIENKFVNEAGAGEGVGDIDDDDYKSEIVCQF